MIYHFDSFFLTTRHVLLTRLCAIIICSSHLLSTPVFETFSCYLSGNEPCVHLSNTLCSTVCAAESIHHFTAKYGFARENLCCYSNYSTIEKLLVESTENVFDK